MDAVDGKALRQLLEDIGSDAEAFRELVEIFLRETPPVVARLQAAGKAHDARGLQSAAHVLKSTAATFGAARLAALARALESDAATGDLADPLTRADEVAREWARVDAALRARLASGQP